MLTKNIIIPFSSDILSALNKAIDNQDEGIVVKDVNSYYLANCRNAGWYKIKPEVGRDMTPPFRAITSSFYPALL